MATVTEPIALDKSINTTEQTPRNIADVLAEELKGIAGAITTSESVEDILSDMATTKDAQIIGGTAVFDTVDGNLVKALKVAITPSQAGSGTPSPSNIRPISGYTEEVISVKDSTDTTQETYTIPFNQTVYGGTLDVLTGELTIDKGVITLNGTENCSKSAVTDSDTYMYTINTANFDSPFILSAFQYTEPNPNYRVGYAWRGSSNTQIRIGFAEYGTSTIESWKAWLSDNPLQICYTLATPTTLSLTPQTVKALVGENHISASTGDVTECKFSMLINGDDLEMLLS
jgi:hypothetical protein